MSSETVKAEYLYRRIQYEDNDGFLREAVIAHWVVKKTPHRVYYILYGPPGRPHPAIGFVDRQELEAKGRVWISRRDHYLYAETPEFAESWRKPNLSELKAQVAAAHPDRGGTTEAFMAARRRYQNAQRALYVARAEEVPA